MTTKTLQIKPYARLLTMLGDQLIKNERVALGEIIKNAYDADASWVKITFENFTANMQLTDASRLIIEDDGVGMTRDIIENHWVNPATPVKALKKKTKSTTDKGRLIQGEKGIGRFALLKLGKKVEITTRAKGDSSELDVVLDVSGFNEDFTPEGGEPLFLDQLTAHLTERAPPTTIQGGAFKLGARTIQRSPHGTRIIISHLADLWSQAKIEVIFKDMVRLQSIYLSDEDDGAADDVPALSQPDPTGFELAIHKDEDYQPFAGDYRRELTALAKTNSVLKVEQGRYDEPTRTLSFLLDGLEHHFRLDDPQLAGLKIYRDRVKDLFSAPALTGTHCGSFGFTFYVFDFSSDAVGNYQLDKQQRQLVKDNRIYLYRDGIRVFPYGDAEDDWLQTDVYRGTVKASAFLSNDQVIGIVNISQKENPALRDKTSREGLIDTGPATDDFFWILKLVLAWIRGRPYSEYRDRVTTKKDMAVFKGEQVQKALDSAAQAADDLPAVKQMLMSASTLYKAERRYLVQRAETTEHLAGVGLSVETASHDLMVALARSLTVVDGLVSQLQRPGQIDLDIVRRDMDSLRGVLSFVQTQMKDVQLLFRSTKQRRKDIRIVDILGKVQRLFEGALARHNIAVEIEEVGNPLVAKTTDAVVLQLLLNLFDNSLYWLEHAAQPRIIKIELNGTDNTLVFADSGPGIRSEDKPFIFDPFFTGKGEEGRGLGLYIARQLLERHGYSIELADLKSQTLLGGANFVVSFVEED
ncbi:ATP-binding protein [Rhizobium laguerreae]|uniref:ATP-binding protein n=1 Tax=Rhizobium laguerreae TaxID=1076926 RepID=UPI00143F5DA1|nr:sensor histidine kinase [Rhizobium laguerreae]NKM89310.1 ATP-binding protein [Rhizobium laguerreae]